MLPTGASGDSQPFGSLMISRRQRFCRTYAGEWHAPLADGRAAALDHAYDNLWT